MSTACEGLKVIEVARGMAGDMVGMVLADNGAEVIKVEPPSRDPMRAVPGFLVWNRGKKSVVLDLKTPQGREKLERLVEGADLVVEDFKPGVADRMEIGYDRLSKVNPGIVYAAITGFGEKGPLRDLPGYEHLVAAKTGRMSSQAGFRDGPIFTPAPIASYGAAMLAIQALLAAVHARRQTGKGQRVHTSLLHALIAYDMSGFRRRGEGGAALPGGKVRGVMEMGFMTPVCKDGRYIQMCSRAPHLFRNWMRVMGLEEVYEDSAYHQMPDLFPSRAELERIMAHVDATMREKTMDEWLEIFLKEDVGGDPFLTPMEFMHHPQTVENGRVTQVEDPTVGLTTQIGPLANFSETPSNIDRPAPLLGQHTEEVLKTIGAANGVAARQPTNGGKPLKYPLEGVTVLDCAFFYAAPFGATLLAEMGARVIKVEPPTGDPTRRNANTPYLKTMQGKESVVLDLKTGEGRDLLYKLAAKADIFLHNFRPGVPQNLKIDYPTLSAVNPRLVYVYGSCFGSEGPWKFRPGFHSTPNALAGSGIVESGRDNPPKDRVFPDPAGALAVATAMMLGLQARERTGKGQYVETTMINSTGYALSHWSLQYDGKPEDPIPDQGQHGYHALHRLYDTSDGWLFLMCPEEAQWLALARGLGLAHLIEDPRFVTAEARAKNDDELATELQQALRKNSATAWEKSLVPSGVPAVRADGIDHHEFLTYDPQALENNVVVEDHLPDGEEFMRAANCTQFSDMETRVASPLPQGWATGAILRELGLSDGEVADLHEKGVTKALGHGLPG